MGDIGDDFYNLASCLTDDVRGQIQAKTSLPLDEQGVNAWVTALQSGRSAMESSDPVKKSGLSVPMFLATDFFPLLCTIYRQVSSWSEEEWHPKLDLDALDHLADLITELAKAGSLMLPLYCGKDGNCLVNGISHAVWGFEYFAAPLRDDLCKELEEHAEWYREQSALGFEYQTVLDEVRDRDAHEGNYQWMNPKALGAMANLLKRPVCLVDSLQAMRRYGKEVIGEGMCDPDRFGTFLPFRVQAPCRKPVVLAWNGENRNHFVPLVGVYGFPEPALPFFPAVEGEGLNSNLCATQKHNDLFDYSLRSEEVTSISRWPSFFDDFRGLVNDLANVHVYGERRIHMGTYPADEKLFAEDVCNWHRQGTPKSLTAKALWELYFGKGSERSKNCEPVVKRQRLESPPRHGTQTKVPEGSGAATHSSSSSSSKVVKSPVVAGVCSSSLRTTPDAQKLESSAIPTPKASSANGSEAAAQKDLIYRILASFQTGDTMKFDNFNIAANAAFSDFREAMIGRIQDEAQKLGKVVSVDGLRFIEKIGRRERDFTEEASDRRFVEIVQNRGTIVIQPANSSIATSVPDKPDAPKAAPETSPVPAKIPAKDGHAQSSDEVRQSASPSSVPSHWQNSSSAAPQSKPSSGKGRKKGPISSDDIGVGKIREVLQDILRAAKNLQGNADAEDELCREVSVAAARVLTRHSAHGVRSLLSEEAQTSEEALKAHFKGIVTARLDTFQTELYKQNVFLAKVPAQVLNDEDDRMWDQVLNQALREAMSCDAGDAVRWIRSLAVERNVRLRDPHQEEKQKTLVSAMARGLRLPADAVNSSCDGRSGDSSQPASSS